MIFSLFFFGFLFSFAGSITPSMLNMTALKISLEKGRKASNTYALGVSLLVIPQIIIAAFLTKYITDNPKILETLEKVGIVIFIFLTFYFYRESKLETINIKKSKSKKETFFPAPIIEQRVRRLEDIPKVLPDQINNKSTIEIMAPPKYQGHGCVKNSFILNF